ncbi:MAG: hypothetical protein V4558_16515 [Gemmatimonadota bacterium]
MYSTCLFCTKALGRNEVIETLPIGRRIAFDAAQGRLWVVCRHCAKWNLVPFDTRLESIETAEGLFRSTRVRFSTDNIGIARVREGLELVRVGPALRPEFAAWRYGDQFGRRRKQNLLIGAGLAAVGVGLIAGGAAVGIGAGLGPQLARAVIKSIRGRRIIVRVPREGADPIQLTAASADRARFQALTSGGWGIRTRLDANRIFGVRTSRSGEDDQVITGPDAERVLAGILGHTNRWMGKKAEVQEAVELVESKGDLHELVTGIDEYSRYSRLRLVKDLPKTWRLATEMALHEQSERDALSGELALLEWQWKEAERLAHISDSLAIQDSVNADLAELQNARRSSIDDQRGV